MVPFARGEKPVIFHAENQVEILDALELARELKLKAVISGAAEAWKVVEALQKAKVPVLLGGSLHLPRKDHDPYDSVYATAAKLHAAGVPFAIRSQAGGPSAATALRNLPYEAATAVAFGLPEDAATPGRHDRPRRRSSASPTRSVRSRPASVPTWSSPRAIILQPTTSVLALFIDGEPIRPGEPPHPALCQVSPTPGGTPHRPGSARDRTGLRP